MENKEKMMEQRQPTPAEEARTNAETAKAEAETRKAVAKAIGHELQAKKWEIELAREEFERAKELASDEYNKHFYFSVPVGEGSVKKCIEQLSNWHRLEPNCPITIVFFSPGGSVIDGMALFDYIMYLRSLGHFITTKALGYAASMAGILLQAGDMRIMSKESWLLIHETQFGAMGSYGEVEDRVKWIEKVQERILSIFATRSNLTKAQLKKRWHRKDWWIDSDEALKLGFIDKVE